MPPSYPIRSLNCPNCNAPIEFPSDEATTVKCHFCGSIVERPAQARPKPPQPPEQPYHPELPTAYLETPPGGTVKTGACAFWGFTGLLVFLGMLAWLILSPSGFSAITRLPFSLMNPAAWLPADAGGKSAVIALGYDPNADRYQLLRVNPADRRLDWQGQTFSDIGDVSALVVGGDRFFTAEGASLHAYDASTGKPLWTAPLSDKIGYCDLCLNTSGNSVTALTQDYVLQVFDADSGAPVWKRKLAGYTDNYWILGNNLLVVDTVEGKTSLFELALADGTAQKTITPTCTSGDYSDSFSNSATVVPDVPTPGAGLPEDVFLFYGWYPGCIERWDLPSGTLTWQTAKRDGYSPSGDLQTLLTTDAVYFSDRNNIWSFRKDTGGVSVELQETDYEILPLSLAGDVLIVRAKRTRGSTQYALWGVQVPGGKKIWEYVFPKGAPLDPPDSIAGFVDSDQSAWTWRLWNGRLDLMEFSAEPNQVAFRSIDPETGAVTEGKIAGLPVSGDFYSPAPALAWDGPVAWMILENSLLGIDIDAQSIGTRYP